MALAGFDTNVVVYATGMRRADADEPKLAIAEHLIADSLAAGSMVLPVQVCLELHRVLVIKRRLGAAAATAIVRKFMESAIIAPSDDRVLGEALTLASRHGLQTYDAIILAAAEDAGCDILYSEDMQDGFEWQGVRIVNPFA